MKIMIIDGQGGRIGKILVEELLKKDLPCSLLVIGTNALATAAMLKGGAQEAATGENPVIFNAPDMDYILGPIGICLANSLNGEITSRMAEAVSSSRARKILIPMSKCNHFVAGTDTSLPLNELIRIAINEIKIV